MPSGIPKSHVYKPRGGKREGAGRPAFKIDWAMVDKYLMSGCSGIQIASVIGISPLTLSKRCRKENHMEFTDYRLEKLEKGNAQLLGKQYELAMKGDKTMLVWLGKNRCGQSEKIESKTELTAQTIQVYLPDNGMSCEDS